MIDAILHAEVQRVAAAPVLLVACDFDGTIAPIADHPDAAVGDPASIDALRRLARAESTHAAIVSGRARTDLRRRFNPSPGLILIGGHGAELPPELPSPPPPAPELLRALADEMRRASADFDGALLETKPTGVALHYRGVRPELRASLRDRIRDAASHDPMPVLREGILVIERGLVNTDKGRALRLLADRVHAAAIVFIGDDATDEDAFSALRPEDLGVKVGPGPTAARLRVHDTEGVRSLLEALLDARRHSLAARALVPIDAHALLSDQRTGALIDPRGGVAWLCTPRFDSPPLFASILGGDEAGCFNLAPADGRPFTSRAYDGPTFTLRTQYPGLSITDYFDCSAGRPFQRAGRSDLIRRVEGAGRVAARFAPRFDFGRAATRLKIVDGGLQVEGSADPIALYAPGITWAVREEGRHQAATASFDVTPATPAIIELRIGSSGTRTPTIDETVRRAATERFWSGWAAPLRLPSLHTDLVRRSALTLKALCHGPTGSFVAAPTTSLPEHLGGVRNWDYRYCWIRDGAMSVAALIRLNCTGPALRFLDWLGAVLDELSGPEHLRPLYTVRGAELGPEGEVSGLAGYANSRPIRVGNGAAGQVQLDVFGVVADLLALLAEFGGAGAPLTPEHFRMLDAMVQAVRLRWKEPDHGIWEIRAPMRHHIHSKCMCWATVHRAIRAREACGEPVVPADRELADAIRTDLLTHGPSPDGHFGAAYGDSSTDAANLVVGLTGLVSPDDPRFAATVRAVEADLLDSGTVRRYLAVDGLPGIEGGFHLCTGWLIESLHLIGRHADARVLLDDYARQAGPLGLYAEERCPCSGRALGNYPQAYSHLALINACVRLET